MRLLGRNNRNNDGDIGKKRGPRRSVESRLRDQERQLAEQNESQRRKRRRAKDAYNAVGFDLMYRNGVCQVEDGLFSQTVAFDDISYQSARDEGQKAIFTGWSKLFDHLGAESSLQVTVANQPVPIEEIGRRRFFEAADDTTAELAREYVLDGTERLAAVNAQLRPGTTLEFDWEDVGATRGLTAKDFVCPQALDFKSQGSAGCYRSDGKWCQVLSIRRIGSELTDRCLADIVDLPIPLTVTLHVQPMDKGRAVSYVKTRLAWMDKEVIDEQMGAVQKGYDFQILSSELKYSKEEAEDLLDHLQNKNQRLLFTRASCPHGRVRAPSSTTACCRSCPPPVAIQWRLRRWTTDSARA